MSDPWPTKSSSIVRAIHCSPEPVRTPTRHPIRALFALSIAGLLAGSPLASAQGATSTGADPNFANPTLVVTVPRDGYAISGLVTHLQGAQTFKYGIALFPGHPGIMRLREEQGQAKFELGGNFLVRSRRHWLDEETLVVVVDAPSDQSGSFYQYFRETPRYGADVQALLEALGRRYGLQDWTFVGTSEGSISAYHAARMNPKLARRTILTASVFRSSRNGPGLSGVAWGDLSSRLFWVHHEEDPCPFTTYRDAQSFSKASAAPILTVRGGGPWKGGACQAFTAHGFVGMEPETVLAMRSWIKTGVVPPEPGR